MNATDNSRVDDGGPAFPIAVPTDFQFAEPGMSLRDWFAGQALPSIISAGTPTEGEGTVFDWMAADAYAFADAMLAARAEIQL